MVKIKLVQKTEKDCMIIFKWRNDEQTVNNSLKNMPYTEMEFKYQFYNRYFDNLIPPLFATKDDIPIAFIGILGKNKNNLSISINLDPNFRGKGLSKEILQKSLEYIKINHQEVVNIFAEIKDFNIPSIKLFTRYGFIKYGEKIFKDQRILQFIYNMNTFKISETLIGYNYPVYFIAEISCNHNQDKSKALELIQLAKDSGANAVKFQTYTPNTMTIKSDKSYFKDCLRGTIWEGETLYDLYSRAFTPWEWHAELKEFANKLGLDFFTSPFDTTAVDFLEKLDVPCYKIASFEVTDHVLIKRVAKTGKPVIISSGMATIGELSEAVELLRENGTKDICILKCTSAYPAKPEDANLRTINHMKNTFGTIVGLSDHTLGLEVPLMSVALGARIIEKHFTKSRDSGSPDDAFSLTPYEFKQMVESVRIAEKTLGHISYGKNNSESNSKKFRKSLFIVKDIKKGEKFTEDNVRPIRPSYGIHTKHYEEIIGKTATKDIEEGEPLKYSDFE